MDETTGADEIKFCLAAADGIRAEIDKLIKEEDYFRWRAAKLIAEELDAGKTQRQLASEIGRSQALVSFMARAWRRFGMITQEAPGNQRPLFQDAYRHVQKGRPANLDYLVPSRDDDDDTRESKITVVWMLADPEGFFSNIKRMVNDWRSKYGKVCPDCGKDHVAELLEAMRAVVAKLDEMDLDDDDDA